MVKIIKQNRNLGDCGIVAAFNAALWCKKYKSYSKIEKIARKFGYSERKGTDLRNFHKILKKINVEANFLPEPSVRDIESYIYEGKAVVIGYKFKNYVGHLVMVYMDKKDRICLINGDELRIGWNNLASELYSSTTDWIAAWTLPYRDKL